MGAGALPVWATGRLAVGGSIFTVESAVAADTVASGVSEGPGVTTGGIIG